MALPRFHGTTIVGVYDGGSGAIGGDGQVTFGEATIIKHGARKVRRLTERPGHRRIRGGGRRRLHALREV